MFRFKELSLWNWDYWGAIRIPLDRERSLVARAARERRGIIVNDVRAAPDFLPNPLLPETRAEAVIPLIA
ncbi:MAG: hypothetical protein WCS72_18505, partial [Deltaproteobacteria bacterium]